MVGLKHGRGVYKIVFEINGGLGWRKRVTWGRPDGHQTPYATCFYTFLLTCSSQSRPQGPHQKHGHAVQGGQGEDHQILRSAGLECMHRLGWWVHGLPCLCIHICIHSTGVQGRKIHCFFRVSDTGEALIPCEVHVHVFDFILPGPGYYI